MGELNVRAYDGTPNYIRGGAATTKRDAIKLTHRKTVKAFREIGDQALNMADYERTFHLPVGRGRLACDPETGEFDPDAIRPPYNPASQPAYPRFVHSTVTEDESIVVDNEVDHKVALSTGKWSDKPMERRKRFKLSADDQMLDFKGQLVAERSRGIALERKMEEILSGASPDKREEVNITAVQLREQQATIDEQKMEIQALKMRMDNILAAIEAGQMKKPQLRFQKKEAVDDSNKEE